jgi:cell wall-associated protease
MYKNNMVLSLLASLWTLCAAAQHVPNWHNKDLQRDSLFGVSTEKAYTLLKGKTPKPVIVAVIDAGVDTLHEDLKGVLWVNPKKRAFDNGTYGWSYIGSAKGNVQYDNLELTRQVRQFEERDTAKLAASDLMDYHAEKKDLQKQFTEAERMKQGMGNSMAILDRVVAKSGKADPTMDGFKANRPADEGEKHICGTLIGILKEQADSLTFRKDQMDAAYNHYKEQASSVLSSMPRPGMNS